MSTKKATIHLENVFESIKQLNKYYKTSLNSKLDEKIFLDAITLRFTVIAEELMKIDKIDKKILSNLEDWSYLSKMRNILVHNYYGIDWNIVIDSIKDLKKLEVKLKVIYKDLK